MFNVDPYSFLGTITNQSLELTSLSAPTTMLPNSDQILIGSAITPENALRIIGNPALSHIYLYIAQRDNDSIWNNNWNNGYLYSHLIPMLPIVFQDYFSDSLIPEVTIYNISKVSPPLPFSDQISSVAIQR